MQVLHSGDLICEGIIKQQAEPAKAEEPKKEEPAAQEPAPVPVAEPVPAAGVTANIAVISVSRLSLLQVSAGDLVDIGSNDDFLSIVPCPFCLSNSTERERLNLFSRELLRPRKVWKPRRMQRQSRLRQRLSLRSRWAAALHPLSCHAMHSG